MNLLIIGDSFCHGIGLESVFRNPANTEQAFGRYIADAMNMTYHNLAEPGSGIERAIDVGYRFVSTNPDTFVIAGWSHPHRIGLYGSQSSLQVLPSFVVLGDTSSTDVWTDSDQGVKFVADQQNQHCLTMLKQFHRTVIDNDFFAGQAAQAQARTDMFKTWLRSQNTKFLDFNVFNGYSNLTHPQVSITFEQIMTTAHRHPSAAEHKQFAKLWIEQYV